MKNLVVGFQDLGPGLLQAPVQGAEQADGSGPAVQQLLGERL